MSESTHLQPADHIWLQTHPLPAVSPLKAQCTHAYEAKACPGMAVIISPASLGTSVLLHALHPYPHHSPLFEASICTAPWHITTFQAACCSSAVCLILGEEFLFIPNCLFNS